MSGSAAPALPVRYANGRFGPGNPGRRAGARSRVSHRAAMAILQDFELHGNDVLNRLRNYFAPAYFAILMRYLDRELQTEAPGFDDYSDEELARTVRMARTALNAHEDPRMALLDLEATLVNQSSVDPTAPAHRINGD